MEDMEQKLGAILNNPEMMSQIMTMAQSFGKESREEKKEPPKKESSAPSRQIQLPSGADLAMLQNISRIAQNTGIDRNQQALLKALSPYLSKDRISKLEKAMRAAKLAGFATTALSSQNLSSITGR